MSKIKTLTKKNIFLFRPQGHGNHLCQLKNFIHFLRTLNVQRPFKFSYVEAFGPLLPNLSLKENIFLESIQNSLSETKEIQLNKLLDQTKNQSLLQLFEKLDKNGLIHKAPNEVSPRIRKIAALLKGLLHGDHFLFLESPETFLTPQDLGQFIKALKFQAILLKQVILISSPNEREWIQYVDKLVTRGASQEFIISSALVQKTSNHYATDYNHSLSLEEQKPTKKVNSPLKVHYLNIDNKKSA